MPNFFIFFPNGPFKLHVMLLGLSLCVKPNSHFNDNIKTKKKEPSFQWYILQYLTIKETNGAKINEKAKIKVSVMGPRESDEREETRQIRQ